MGAFSRLDVPIVYGSLRDRWFAVLKPPGFVARASPQMPSVEATLRPFCDRELSFPIRPEKEVQGLLIVTTDDAMKSCFLELFRQRLVHSTFRVLADVSTPACRASVAPPVGLPFVGCERLSTGRLLGSLRAPMGAVQDLLQRGQLSSYVGPRPLRLPVQPRPQETVGPAGGRLPSARAAEGAWPSVRELKAGLQGEAVPTPLQGTLSHSLLSHSRSPQSAYAPCKVAVTEFELISGPVACRTAPSLQTAVYLARACTSAGHQVRVHFADAGCPVLFDPYYHPRYNREVRRKAFPETATTQADDVGRVVRRRSLGLQLCSLELPDPLKPSEALRISVESVPWEWRDIHPSPDLPGSSLHEVSDEMLG